jgi:hypothetical protein
MTKTIAERLTEYRNSDEFQEDFALYKTFTADIGSSESEGDIVLELIRSKSEQLEAQDACERDGHIWHESATYPEDGMSDMECDRCGEFWRISFTA